MSTAAVVVLMLRANTDYRVRAEHKQGYQLSDEQISEVTSLAMKFIVEFYSRRKGIRDFGSASNDLS